MNAGILVAGCAICGTGTRRAKAKGAMSLRAMRGHCHPR
jgi:hypothetical protein